MSKAYLEKVEKEGVVDMRAWCSRPGRRGSDGKPVYFTQQNHKKECDVNLIIAKYDKTGLIQHVQKLEGRYGDVTGVDFRKAQDLYINAQRMFENLPVHIKKRFRQNAGDFLEFMENPDNREEAIQLGLIKKEWKEETDGLGEHVKSADDYKDKEPSDPEGKKVASKEVSKKEMQV